MIDLYTWGTPNGRKISIMLEEVGLAYTVHPVNIGKGEQFETNFLRVSPNNKIPAIVDRDTGQSVFESGAILIYLAEKTGSPLLPASGSARAATLEWLFFQVGGLGPMFGQYNHFVAYASEPVPYAIKRYTEEALRLFGVLERRLAVADYLAGDYSIADIAAYAWVRGTFDRLAASDDGFPARHAATAQWLGRVGARPAVIRGMSVPA